MKIMHEHLDLKGKNSLKVKWDDFPHFTFPWHFHPEFELIYVIRSFGKRFVGDNAGHFSDGDLVLLGPNLPHFWKNDDAFFLGDPRLKVNAVVIHFPPDFFDHQIEHYPEFVSIRQMLSRASRGISFSRTVSDKLGPDFLKLLKLKGINRTLLFIKLLDRLSHTKTHKLLASDSYRSDFSAWPADRINKVTRLVNAIYRKPMKLETVAAHIGMNPSAFSRYFREKTGKSFIMFVNEMRIGYACKLLQEDKYSISQVSLESGFNNLSNFNRLFKKITSLTPAAYRSQFIG